MKLASYRGTRPGVQGIANRLIRLRLRSVYSHSEVVFMPSDGVDHLMPDGTCQPDADGALWCTSSVAAERLPAHSARRAGRVGGVRFKRIVIDPLRWDLRPVAGNPVHAAQWFRDHEGDLYDWQLVAGNVAWLIPQKEGRWHCGEAVAAALGLPDPWRFDPANLDAIARLMTPLSTSTESTP